MNYYDACGMVVKECENALMAVDQKEADSFIQSVLAAEKVFFIGVGRVLLSLQAMAKRFAHLGIDAHIVGEITEPAITNKDVLVIASGSGESIIPVAIAKKAFALGAKIIHIGSNPENSIMPYRSLFVRIPVRTKLYLADEISSEQPMSSLFEQSLLLFGDVAAKLIIEDKAVDLKSLWAHHANIE